MTAVEIAFPKRRWLCNTVVTVVRLVAVLRARARVSSVAPVGHVSHDALPATRLASSATGTLLCHVVAVQDVSQVVPIRAVRIEGGPGETIRVGALRRGHADAFPIPLVVAPISREGVVIVVAEEPPVVVVGVRVLRVWVVCLMSRTGFDGDRLRWIPKRSLGT